MLENVIQIHVIQFSMVSFYIQEWCLQLDHSYLYYLLTSLMTHD